MTGRRSGTAPTAAALVDVFDALFAVPEHTILRGGADEPLYTPAAPGRPAVIHFREDYAASVLHEVAHWCIAGPARRRQLDYGYWYAPDGRSADQQAAFIAVEAQPQALELLFSLACGLPFRISMDNLHAPRDRAAEARLAEAVSDAARRFRRAGLPPRAAAFSSALTARFDGAPTPTDAPIAADLIH